MCAHLSFHCDLCYDYRKMTDLERVAAVSVTALLRPISLTRKVCLLASGAKIKQQRSAASPVKGHCLISALMMAFVRRKREKAVTVPMG